MTLAALLVPDAARAAAGGTLSLVSDDLFRGRSLSAGHPVARLSVALDLPSGAYLGTAGSVVLGRGSNASLLATQEYGGYARRLRSGLTLDVGLINTNYTRRWSGESARGYTEVYAGLLGRRFSSHLNVSPNYFQSGRVTAYGDVDAVLLAHGDWRAGVHGGVLLWLAGGRPAGAPVAHYDWRLGLTRRLGRFQAEAAWASGGPNSDFYGGRGRRRGRAYIGLSASF